MTMTKAEMHKLLKGQVSRSAIRVEGNKVEDEIYVHGKWAQATLIGDNTWDVFIHNTADIAAGLSGAKLHSIIKRLDDACVRTIGPYKMFDGEAAVIMSTEELLSSLKVLGIRRSRVMTEESKEAMLQRLHPGKFTPMEAAA
jgi:hypothetical protein